MVKCLELKRIFDYNRGMKTIHFSQIVQEVQNLTSACSRIDGKCLEMMEAAAKSESNQNAKFALDMLIQNAKVADKNALAVCQDTGMAVFFVNLGQDVHIEGGLLTDAINEGVRRGYAQN